MASRGRTTFQKRQKELARKERQQAKEQRRAQRKLTPVSDGDVTRPSEADSEPEPGSDWRPTEA